MHIYLIAVYVCGSLLAGLFGRRTRVGFWGCFTLSLVFSPLLVLLFLVVLEPITRRRARG